MPGHYQGPPKPPAPKPKPPKPPKRDAFDEQNTEDAAGKSKIGTTRRGIGPAYEDKVGRRSIRVMDLRSEKNLNQRLETVLLHHNAIRKGLGKKIFE